MRRHGTPAAELAAHFGINAELSSSPVTQRSARAPKRVPKGHAHQLKVALRDTRPLIWRRVVVEGTQTLDHLHEVIQAAFGWWNYHLHEFSIDGITYSVPSEDDWKPVKDERRVTIDRALAGARRIHYMYDFGDGWHHDIAIEKTTPADATMPVPDCIDGRRACPPEDCGGTWGYRHLLEALADSAHPEHAQLLEWTGGGFDPEEFDPSEFADNLDLLNLNPFD
ncbi:UNVERIFIED_CONTAM: hypothetical protein GTU68_043498 [Idotea baltica]|nr:hypothetical protein [Idotea baltica]